MQRSSSFLSFDPIEPPPPFPPPPSCTPISLVKKNLNCAWLFLPHFPQGPLAEDLALLHLGHCEGDRGTFAWIVISDGQEMSRVIEDDKPTRHRNPFLYLSVDLSRSFSSRTPLALSFSVDRQHKKLDHLVQRQVDSNDRDITTIPGQAVAYFST